MKKILPYLGLVTVCCGCTAVKHLPEISVLRQLAKQQKETDAYVADHDQKFYDLVQAIADKHMDAYPNEAAVLARFGEPIQKEKVERDGQTCEQWLYRRAAYYFNVPKVYLTFNLKGDLIDYLYEPVKE